MKLKEHYMENFWQQGGVWAMREAVKLAFLKFLHPTDLNF